MKAKLVFIMNSSINQIYSNIKKIYRTNTIVVDNAYSNKVEFRKNILAKESNIDLNEFYVSRTANGKPFMIGNEKYFNISHSNSISVYLAFDLS